MLSIACYSYPVMGLNLQPTDDFIWKHFPTKRLIHCNSYLSQTNLNKFLIISNDKDTIRFLLVCLFVCLFVWLYGISTFVGYLMPNPFFIQMSSWCNGESDGLLNRSKWVRTPVTLLRSLSGKYPWERYEPPYPPSYGLNSTTTVLLWEQLWY